ncbi:MarR family winged helix-turn-helix transcriptional regulator [uncultured Eubacterium sp.]|uniref:MarR family winged helix-turn-helix transcriptional regulator n=1 Tax=uncultured Eubacterium sp. TaxID=165185 RepID=UPI0025E838B3|nr:MarR family transcriptional regulator [uncultured Eubacterium sp.]
MDDIYSDIYEKLSTLQWLMKRHQMFRQAESGPFADTTRGQGRILAMLKIQPEIATKELAYLLGIRQQSLNELLNKLEKNGYVERKPSKSDKRVMIVHLTEKGKQLQQPETDYQNIFSCLLPEELQQLSQYLDRIIDAFQAQTGNPSGENEWGDWMSQARERMGDEHFEQLMSMRERAFGHMRPPKDIPGAERFSENYNGPVSDREGFPPHIFRQSNQ